MVYKAYNEYKDTYKCRESQKRSFESARDTRISIFSPRILMKMLSLLYSYINKFTIYWFTEVGKSVKKTGFRKSVKRNRKRCNLNRKTVKKKGFRKFTDLRIYGSHFCKPNTGGLVAYSQCWDCGSQVRKSAN